MSKKATEFQRKAMSWMYRGKEIFKPLNTGWIDENVACVREWVANIFFYRKGDTTIMVDAGYNYDRLAEKMSWLGIDPKSIHHILITHQDTDHVGAVEADSPGLFRNAKLYIGEIENRYLTGEVRRKVIYHLYKLPQVTINNEKVLLHDDEVIDIDGIRIECFLVPGHTWGHMVYLVDGKYLFTGDTIWFGADGGYGFKLLDASLQIVDDWGTYPFDFYMENFQDLCVSGDLFFIFPLTMHLGIGNFIQTYSLSQKTLLADDTVDFGFSDDITINEPEDLCETNPGEFIAIVNVKKADGGRYVQFYRTRVPYLFTVSTSAAEHGSVSEGGEFSRGEEKPFSKL